MEQNRKIVKNMTYLQVAMFLSSLTAVTLTHFAGNPITKALSYLLYFANTVICVFGWVLYGKLKPGDGFQEQMTVGWGVLPIFYVIFMFTLFVIDMFNEGPGTNPYYFAAQILVLLNFFGTSQIVEFVLGEHIIRRLDGTAELVKGFRLYFFPYFKVEEFVSISEVNVGCWGYGHSYELPVRVTSNQVLGWRKGDISEHAVCFNADHGILNGQSVERGAEGEVTFVVRLDVVKTDVAMEHLPYFASGVSRIFSSSRLDFLADGRLYTIVAKELSRIQFESSDSLDDRMHVWREAIQAQLKQRYLDPNDPGTIEFRIFVRVKKQGSND